MVHMLTIEDLETRPEGAYYTGPLEEAKNFIRTYSNVSVCWSTSGLVAVYFNQDDDTEATGDNCTEFGKANTEEDAWRWALGAAFGPADDEFSAFPLTHDKREAVRAMVDHHFPDRLDAFYSETTELAAVEDKDGNMWRVWPDGAIEVYRR